MDYDDDCTSASENTTEVKWRDHDDFIPMENDEGDMICEEPSEMVSNTHGKKCNQCDLVFPDSKILANHKHKHNLNAIGKFQSKFCTMTFGTASSRRIHDRLHTGEKPFECSECRKRFADRSTLNKHFRIHSGEKPFECVLCVSAFNQNVTLRNHIRSRHSAPDPELGTPAKPYSCSKCSSLFTNAEDLIQHLCKHCDDKRTLTRKRPIYTETIPQPATCVRQPVTAVRQSITPEREPATPEQQSITADVDDVETQENIGDIGKSLRKLQTMSDSSAACNIQRPSRALLSH